MSSPFLSGLTPVFAAATLLVAATGCDTEAFCFNDCGQSTGSGSTSSAGGSGGAGGGFVTTNSTGSFTTDSSTGVGGCEPTNGGIEICDQVDNDCNGTVDDVAGIDYNDPKTCGTCSNNCYTSLINMDPATVQCAPSSDPGNLPGTCSGDCAADYFDIDGDGQSCEYFCVASATDDVVCDAKDDDCDGTVDEDVDLCTSTQNCGKCGGICNFAHATAQCVHTGSSPTCSPVDTSCKLAACDPGYVDLDGSAATGCEYQCTPSGPEVCGDQIDNDCDGLIDAADDLSGDPAIGVQCFGDPDGICGTVAHAGVTTCTNGVVACTGANVLHEGDVLETCNGLDDNCDGQVDNSPTDAGGSCGTSNIFPCAFGTKQCISGAIQCVGAIAPGTETCNGVDDNCDGIIDKTGTMAPADSIGTCGGHPAAPPGGTTPCVNGNKSCVGGTVQCIGEVGPTAPNDTCGVDANCNGMLENQPNKMTDPFNCGTCGHNCAAGTNATYTCSAGGCVFGSCLPGYYDLNNDGICEYACTFISAQEACNAIDDNCDGLIDNNPTMPSKTQVCGISPSASRPECTTQVGLACMAGAWKCTFPAGVCSGGCSANDEICDGLDNDCDGFLNENVPDFGAACASDDAAPSPGDGACRTTGMKICNGTSATVCSAVKANCSTLANGCTEVCDGIDNDCDGSTDETFNNKGSNATYFVKPNVTKVASNKWMYQYEASRPKATSTSAGNGNGFWTSPLPGNTTDKTPSCSLPGKIPWFNVTPLEADQTCTAMGGSVCSQADWQTSCQATVPCTWGYSPRGAACTSTYTGSKFCNLSQSYDFDSTIGGIQDGLLPTGSSALQNCWADWTGTPGNTVTTGKIYDMTGNLREITQVGNSNTFDLMGGAFNTQSENGATCSFKFYATDDEFKFYDTGFRCCFSADPTL